MGKKSRPMKHQKDIQERSEEKIDEKGAHDEIIPSNTGHEFHPAKKAPLSSKDSAYLGGYQSSDAAEAEVKGKRPHHAHAQKSGGEQKRIGD